MKIKIAFIISLLFYQVHPQSQSQIDQVKKYAKDSGMSLSQIEAEAKARGYSESQIDKIKKEQGILNQESREQSINDINDSKRDKNKDGKNLPLINNVESVFKNLEESEENINLKVNEPELDIVDESDFNFERKTQESTSKLKYFGYDIFQQDPSLFQSTSVGAVDPEYLIGPGDEIIVMLWGETQFRQVLEVDREGFIFIPEIGQVFVNGLNLKLLESKLFRVLAQSYDSLDPQGMKATTFLDVSLGNLRPLRIQVIGEVAQPGAYTISPSTTLFSSLYYFNGPTVLGSLRDIRLIRGGEQISSIDFYDYLLKGKKSRDQKLMLDDVVFIPKRELSISIGGQVNRPGIYELKDKEDLKDLIRISGGLRITAYLHRAQVDRIVPFDKRKEVGSDRIIIDVDLDEILASDEAFDLEDGDRIEVFSVLDQRSNVAQISGSVTRPGNYDIGNSMKLKELILKADGLLGDAYMGRVDIVRFKSDFNEKIIELNLSKVMEDDSEHNISIQGLDKITVYSTKMMVPEKYVSISGHVKNAGKYLLREDMTLYDLIFKAGGFFDENFRNKTYLDRAELIRTVNDNKKEVLDFNLGLVIKKEGIASYKLRQDDFVKVYSFSEIKGDKRTVFITGHVKRPGEYELFDKNMTLYDLVFKAGGFEDIIFRSQTFLERADIIRFNPDFIRKSIISFNLGKLIDNDSDENLKLQPGDLIRIYSSRISEFGNFVSINGVIRNPGKYELKTDMHLKDLILEAGGINSDVYGLRLDISRIGPDISNKEKYSESYTIDFNNDDSIYKSDGGQALTNFKLKPYDYITLRPDPFFKEQKKVTIDGEVFYPGDYVILNREEKVYDIIKRAGGMKPDAFPSASKFIREGKTISVDFKNINKNLKSSDNIRVYNNDKIIIAKKKNIIQIKGEVNSPGYYKFSKGMRVREFIKIAGGFTQSAEIKDIYIKYPDGKSKKYSGTFRNPKVMDGSVVFVGKAPESKPFDKTEFAKEVTAILANLAQVISIIIIANN